MNPIGAEQLADVGDAEIAAVDRLEVTFNGATN
jgi:hypothetical protein